MLQFTKVILTRVREIFEFFKLRFFFALILKKNITFILMLYFFLIIVIFFFIGSDLNYLVLFLFNSLTTLFIFYLIFIPKSKNKDNLFFDKMLNLNMLLININFMFVLFYFIFIFIFLFFNLSYLLDFCLFLTRKSFFLLITIYFILLKLYFCLNLKEENINNSNVIIDPLEQKYIEKFANFDFYYSKLLISLMFFFYFFKVYITTVFKRWEGNDYYI